MRDDKTCETFDFVNLNVSTLKWVGYVEKFEFFPNIALV